MTCKVSEDQTLVLVDEYKDAWVKTQGDRIDDIFLSGGKAVGVFVAYRSLLERSEILKTFFTMWVLRILYYLAISPQKLARYYKYFMTG